MLSDLQGRGVQDILIALVDGLPGFPDAIHAVFPQTVVHQCVVHLVRQSLAQVNWRGEGGGERPAGDLPGARRGGRAAGPRRLGRESLGPGTFGDHGAVAAALGAAGPGAGVPVPVRRLLYSTNAIESLHRTLRKSLKVRGTSSAEAASKLLYLALRNAQAKLGTPQHWVGGAAAHPAPLRGPGPGMAVNQAHTQRN
ncbi:MAG: transposase [Gemmatimonadetes bacterium]|nr:transposase [Gemmatimonadota bacterium]